jgi:superfamily II DNA/RNA helicase
MGNARYRADVAARGIDVRDISHVINFDPPEESDSYTHRIGRTARAGRTGVGIRSSTARSRATFSRSPRS